MAQGEGICGSALIHGPGQTAINSLLQDIHALHSLLLTLVINAEADNKSHSLCEIAWRDKLDPLFSNLGSRPGQLPPLLAWSLVQSTEVAGSNGSAVSGVNMQYYSKMAQRSLQGGVLPYLHSVLGNQAIRSDALLADISCSVVYALVCVAGSRLYLDECGPITPTHLAVTCLSCALPAQLFWQEEGGGAGLFLPDALSAFPARPALLLGLCTSLAKAGPDSCDKVVELLSEVPSLTWSMSDSVLAGTCSEVGGSQVVTHSPLNLLPGFTLPPHTSGTLLIPTAGDNEVQYKVQWHMTVNIWQLLLAALHALDEQVSFFHILCNLS